MATCQDFCLLLLNILLDSLNCHITLDFSVLIVKQA